MPHKKPMPKSQQKRILMVIAPSGYRPAELYEPKNILEGYGASVVVASKNAGVIHGMPVDEPEWQTAVADVSLGDVSVSDYDAVLFIGGAGVREIWNDRQYTSLARAAADAGILIGAICIAPMILANANLLSGKKSTIHGSEASTFISKGPNYVDSDVVRSGNIITAAGPHAASDFAEAVAEAIGLAKSLKTDRDAS
ncbi:MAG: DJ-1/PfpI family protein [archaeon]